MGLLTSLTMGRHSTWGYPHSMIWGVPRRLSTLNNLITFFYIIVSASAYTVYVSSSLWWVSVGGRDFKTERWGRQYLQAHACLQYQNQDCLQRLPALSMWSVDLTQPPSFPSHLPVPLPGEEIRCWCLSLCTYISGLTRVLCLPSAEWLALTGHAFQGPSSPMPLPLPCGLDKKLCQRKQSLFCN